MPRSPPGLFRSHRQPQSAPKSQAPARKEARTAEGPRGRGAREPGPGPGTGRSAAAHPSAGRRAEARSRSSVCFLRQLLPRRSPFVDTVVPKSACVHFIRGPAGTPTSCDSFQNINTGRASQTEIPICFPGAGRERGVVEDKAEDNAACLQWTSPGALMTFPVIVQLIFQLIIYTFCGRPC